MDKNNKLKLYDYLLILGLVTAPMTQLRVIYIGISELLLFIFIVMTFIKYNKEMIISKTSIGIIFLIIFMSLGTIFGHFRQTSTKIDYYELFNFVFLLVFVTCLENYWKNKDVNEEVILKKIIILSTLIFGFLFFWSQFISSKFLLWDLYFGGVRLSLWAKNPHQLVRSSGVLIFLSLMFLFNERKIIYIFPTVLFVIISLQTESSTFIASIILIIILFLLIILYKKTNFIITFIITGFIFILSIYKIDYIMLKITNFIESDPNGVGRLVLWESAIIQSKQYILFGNGFGPQIPFEVFRKTDVHNTYLDILLRGGITTLSLYLIIIYFSLRNTFDKDLWIFMILIYFVLYGIAGVVMRNPIFWFFIFLANQKKRGDNFERKRN